MAGLEDGSLPMEALDKAVENVLKLVEKYAVGAEQKPADFEAHHALAAEIAADCAVLLKNDGTLPLTGKEKLLVVGEMFEKMRYQGAGSSMINPTKTTSPRKPSTQRALPTPTARVIRKAAQMRGNCVKKPSKRLPLPTPCSSLRGSTTCRKGRATTARPCGFLSTSSTLRMRSSRRARRSPSCSSAALPWSFPSPIK